MFGRSLRGSVAGTHDVTPSAQVVPVQRSPPGQRPMDGTGRPVASCSGQQGGTVPEPSCDAEYKVAGGSHGTTRQRALIASAIAEADTPVTASTRNARARTIGQGLRADAAACQRKSCVDGKRRRGIGAARWLPFIAGPSRSRAARRTHRGARRRSTPRPRQRRAGNSIVPKRVA